MDLQVKKWMLGLIGGAAMIVSTAAVPSDAVYGVLFPSAVTIHNGTEAVTMNRKGDDILNFNDKAYVPLRAFAEAMGATVKYEPASDKNGGLHQIDINREASSASSPPSAVQWTLQHDQQSYCGNFPFLIMPELPEEGTQPTDSFHFIIYNQTKENITVSPIELTFEVRDKSGTVVYSEQLPTFSGIIPSTFGYEAKVDWDRTGSDGKTVPSGEYTVRLVQPAEIRYKPLESDQEKTGKIERGLGGCNLNEIRITV